MYVISLEALNYLCKVSVQAKEEIQPHSDGVIHPGYVSRMRWHQNSYLEVSGPKVRTLNPMPCCP